MAGLEARRILGSFAGLVGDLLLRPHLPPRYLTFNEQWNMAESEMTPEGQAEFFDSEIKRLRERILNGRVEHRTIDQGKTTLYLDLKPEDIKFSILPQSVKDALLSNVEGQKPAIALAIEAPSLGGKIALRLTSSDLGTGDWVDLIVENKVDSLQKTGRVVSWAQGSLGHRLEGFIARGDLGVARELVRLADFVIDRRTDSVSRFSRG